MFMLQLAHCDYHEVGPSSIHAGTEGNRCAEQKGIAAAIILHILLSFYSP